MCVYVYSEKNTKHLNLQKIIIFLIIMSSTYNISWATYVTGILLNKNAINLAITDKIKYKTFTLQNPDRLVIDLNNTEWKVTNIKTSKIIPRIRHNMRDKNTLRIVLDSMQPIKISKHQLRTTQGKQLLQINFDIGSSNVTNNIYDVSPFDVLEQGKVKLAQNKNTNKIPKKNPEKKQIPKQETTQRHQTTVKPITKKVIVLDAGHGGKDSGTVGINLNTKEKNLTLDYMKAIRRKLEATGKFKVEVTRETDIFIPLQQRLNKARKVGADLFVSIHADANHNRKAKGLSIYTLSDRASNQRAERMASGKNLKLYGQNIKIDSLNTRHLLVDMTRNYTGNIAKDFSHLVIKNMPKDVKLLKQQELSAGFWVLKGIDMPAVLIELGFLSNPEEERKLLSANYKNKIVDTIVRSINDLFK